MLISDHNLAFFLSSPYTVTVEEVKWVRFQLIFNLKKEFKQTPDFSH